MITWFKELFTEIFNKKEFINDCAEKGLLTTLFLYSICILIYLLLFIISLPILPFIIINELSKKYFKNKINNKE